MQRLRNVLMLRCLSQQLTLSFVDWAFYLRSGKQDVAFAYGSKRQHRTPCWKGCKCESSPWTDVLLLLLRCPFHLHFCSARLFNQRNRCYSVATSPPICAAASHTASMIGSTRLTRFAVSASKPLPLQPVKQTSMMPRRGIVVWRKTG